VTPVHLERNISKTTYARVAPGLEGEGDNSASENFFNPSTFCIPVGVMKQNIAQFLACDSIYASSRILLTRTRQWQATPTACPLAHGLANPSSDTSSVQHCNFLPYYHQARHTRRLACQLAPPPPRRVIIYRPPEGAYSCYSMQPARRITYRVHRSTAGLIIASAPLASHRYTSVITCHINNTSHALRTADAAALHVHPPNRLDQPC